MTFFPHLIHRVPRFPCSLTIELHRRVPFYLRMVYCVFRLPFTLGAGELGVGPRRGPYQGMVSLGEVTTSLPFLP